MLNSRSIPESRGRSLSLKTARRSKSPGDFYASVRCHGLVLTASILTLFALRCDRNRNNPLGPQSDFVRERPATPTGLAADHHGQDDSSFTRRLGRIFFYLVASVDTTGLRSELSGFVGRPLKTGRRRSPSECLSRTRRRRSWTRRGALERTSARRRCRELSGLAGYVIMRADVGTGTAVPIATVAVNVREYVDTGVRSLTSYRYTVTALNEKWQQQSGGRCRADHYFRLGRADECDGDRRYRLYRRSPSPTLPRRERR